MEKPTLLYRPADGWVGDVIPSFAHGAFHIFYLFDDRDAKGAWRGLDWAHLRSSDLVRFEELPIAIPRGQEDELDLICGTGSMVTAPDGRHVIHYAGINPRNPKRGFPAQVVLRAFSVDLIHWRKDQGFVLQADERWYERNDWRDPFVYRDDEGVWQMLLCARVKEGPSDRRGAFGLASSTDTLAWEVRPPVLAPGTTNAPECPDRFRMEGDEYLVYASYSDRFATRYRVLDGDGSSWRVPAEDALEARDVYAMKTAWDGEHRYLMGWLATRAGDRDAGHRQWGGDLLIHELTRRDDGELGVQPLASLLQRFEPEPAQPVAGYGTWATEGGDLIFDGAGLGWLVLGEVGETCLLDVTVGLEAEAEVEELAVVMRADPGLERGYHLRLEPRRRRVVFDRRPHVIRIPFDEGSDRAYVDASDHEIERPLRPDGGSVRIRVILDGSAIIAYVDDVALSTRGYDLAGGFWGVMAAGGSARFTSASQGRLAR